MRRAPAIPLLLLLSALAGTPARAQLQAGQTPFLEQVEVDLVDVDVRVTDASGQPVTGLRKGDFELFEDGKPVAITNFAEITPEAAPPRSTALPAPAAPPATGPPPAAAPPPTPPDSQRLSLVVYFDDWNLRPAHRERVLAALRRFLTQELAPSDRVMLVSYDQGVHLRLPFTTDRAAISAALDQIATLATPNDLESQRRTALSTLLSIRQMYQDSPLHEPCDGQVEQPVQAYAESTRHEVERSLRGLHLLVSSLAGVPGKKAFLYVSDGLPMNPGQDLYELLFQICGGGQANGELEIADPGSGGYQGTHSMLDAGHHGAADDFRKITNQANAQGVPFYTLQASGLDAPVRAAADVSTGDRMIQLPAVEAARLSDLRNGLNYMATETGGRAIFDANDPAADLRQVRADFDRYYSLAYSPAHHGDGKEHRIEVRAKRRGLNLRYRQGYRDKPALERAVDRTLAALLHGFEDNPLEITLTPQENTPAEGGSWQVPVRLRIPLFKLAMLTRDQSFEGHLRLLVMTRDEGDPPSPVRQVDVPIHIPKTQVLTALGQYYAYDLSLRLPPGKHRLAVAVRDEYGGTASYLGQDLLVGTSKAAR